jgi:hypothetical protein
MLGILCGIGSTCIGLVDLVLRGLMWRSSCDNACGTTYQSPYLRRIVTVSRPIVNVFRRIIPYRRSNSLVKRNKIIKYTSDSYRKKIHIRCVLNIYTAVYEKYPSNTVIKLLANFMIRPTHKTDTMPEVPCHFFIDNI